MDWGRAKTILIVSFLALNIMLGFQLWSGRLADSRALSDSQQFIDETNKMFADKQIRITASVPKEMPRLRQITVKMNDPYRNPQQVDLEKPVTFVNLFSRSSLKEVMNKSSIQYADAYKPDAASNKDGVYVLTQMAGNLPLFDITLQLYEQKGKITGYKQAYVEIQSGGEEQDQQVISAYTALRSLTDILAQGSTITDVRLGFHGQKYDSDFQNLFPFWRVSLSDGTRFYVHAFSGAVEGSPDTRK